MTRFARTIPAALLLAGTLAAAPARAADPEPEDKKASEEKAEERQDETCPRLAVLADADRSTVFDGKGRDVTNIVYQASLGQGTVECRHRKGYQLNVTVTTVVGVTLGLAAEAREIDVPYFIALIDPEELVVTKLQGVARVSVERGNRTGAATVESKTIRLVLEQDTLGADLEVVVGLQLSEDQLDYNRTGH